MDFKIFCIKINISLISYCNKFFYTYLNGSNSVSEEDTGNEQEREKERESFNPIVQFPKGDNNQVCAQWKPEARNSVLASSRGGKGVIFGPSAVAFPDAFTGSQIRSKAVIIQNGPQVAT